MARSEDVPFTFSRRYCYGSNMARRYCCTFNSGSG